MRKRNVTITIRCTEDERQRIYNKARQHGLTLSDFVLRSALGKKIVTADGLADVLKEQKSIGRNLNQIALLGNMGRLKSVRLDELIAQHEKATAIISFRALSISLSLSSIFLISLCSIPARTASTLAFRIFATSSPQS